MIFENVPRNWPLRHILQPHPAPQCEELMGGTQKPFVQEREKNGHDALFHCVTVGCPMKMMKS